jgi:hypothetical protein
MEDRVSKGLKAYDQVRVTSIRGNRFVGQPVFYSRHPQVGDIAVIVDTHEADYAHEVECSNPESGETIWLDTMFADELEPYST